MTDPILLRARGLKNSRSIATYCRQGGYSALEKALTERPDMRDWASRDPDLASLHGDPRFEALVERS